jgi:hypothetical protein
VSHGTYLAALPPQADDDRREADQQARSARCFDVDPEPQHQRRNDQFSTRHAEEAAHNANGHAGGRAHGRSSTDVQREPDKIPHERRLGEEQGADPEKEPPYGAVQCPVRDTGQPG